MKEKLKRAAKSAPPMGKLPASQPKTGQPITLTVKRVNSPALTNNSSSTVKNLKILISSGRALYATTNATFVDLYDAEREDSYVARHYVQTLINIQTKQSDVYKINRYC